jgi:hypothetical protein
MNVFLLVKQTPGVISFKLTTTIGFQETEITIVQGEKKTSGHGSSVMASKH